MDRIAFRTCPLCEAMCGLELTLNGDDKITSARGDVHDPFSKGFICPKGASLGKLDSDPDKLRTPLVQGAPASWEDAFEAVRVQLRRVIDTHGKNSVAVYLGNPSAHSLAGPLYGPAVIKSIGTRSIFSASTADQMPKHVSSGYLFGDPLAIPVPDLDRTDYLLMLGANPLESNGSLCSAPDFPGRLRAIKKRGGRVVVLDPRRTRTAAMADQHVPIKPGSDAHFLFALVHTLFKEELTAVNVPVDGLDRLRELAETFTPESVEHTTGIPAETTRTIARQLAAAPTAAVYGRIGTCTQEFGTLASWLVDVLNILTGNLDRPGGAMFPKPAHWTGKRTRPYVTGRWSSRVRGLPEANGELPVATLAEEIETEGEGQIKALITVGGNPVLSAPNGERLDRAFAGLEFMVSVDPYLNETTRHADVVLPPPPHSQAPHYDLALSGFSVRNYARFSPAVADRGDRPSEAEILARIAVIGSGLDAEPADLDEMVITGALQKAVRTEGSKVYGRDPDELRAMLGAPGAETRLDLMLRLGAYGDGFGGQGLTLAGLRDDHPHGVDLGALESRLDEVLVHERIQLCPDLFADDVARLRVSRPDEAFVLIGRRHLRSNNSWMHNIDTLVSGSNTCSLQLNTGDADKLGIKAGERVRVTSRVGELTAEAEPLETIMPGVVSLPHGWGHGRKGTRMSVAEGHAGVSVNTLTDEQQVDPLSGNAVFNGVPVQLTRL
ncbi:MAG: molybdopterin-dependent oxidoreductase [Streptosporangiaceae bacterium]